MEQEKAPTLFADFANRNEADEAISALEGMGVDSADISVITKEANRVKVSDASGDGAGDVAQGALGGAATGGVVGGIAGLLAGAGVIPALAGILVGGPLVAALGLTGIAATTVSGAVTGALAGGLIGALVGVGMSEDDARYYSDAVDRGAIVLAVRTTEENEARVRSVLERISTTDNRVERGESELAAAGDRRVRRIMM
jgi:surface antigen